MPQPDRFMLIHLPSQTVVAHVARIGGFWERGIGVIGKRALPQSEGIWLPGVSSIHTCFVAFTLDILFLDKDFQTLRIERGVRPWRPYLGCRHAAHTIELGAGTLASDSVFSYSDMWKLASEPI